MKRAVFAGLAVLLAAVTRGSPAVADEGMWTFDNFPIAKLKTEYGLDINSSWLDHVRNTSVRLSNGCSASIVSADSLVLTNNHCVADCALDLTTAKQDIYRYGYFAAVREDERVCAGLQADILVAVTDITSKMKEVGAGLHGAALVTARNAVTNGVERLGCKDPVQFKCEVVSLYHGGQYKLYRYRTYNDIRLVFSPGVQTSQFGGDPDNFNFPRYDLDAAFLRLYDAGVPVSRSEHLRWTPVSPRDGELVFVAGNPQSTDRELTVAQLETQRDLALPFTIGQVAELRGRLIRFSEENAANRRSVGATLSDVENDYKYYVGSLTALDDATFMSIKMAEEAQLRADHRAKGAGSADPWADIARAQQALSVIYVAYRQIEHGPFGSKLFTYARDLVRAAEEGQKPSGDRLPRYAESQLPLLKKQLLDAQPVDPAIEQLTLEFWLSKTREGLGVDDDSVRRLLGRDSPETLSRLLSHSHLADAAERRALLNGGLRAVDASDDPMIRLMLRIEPAARSLRTRYDEQVVGPVTRAAEMVAAARFARSGDALYPDATSTLRLSYGKVSGWQYRGRSVGPFTSFAGLYERATGQPPFDLDPRWIAARDRLDLATIFNGATTNDTVGGNSGSPLIDAQGDLIGVLFDGNAHSLGGNYGYDAATNRAVVLSAAAITQALGKVFGAASLLRELEMKP